MKKSYMVVALLVAVALVAGAVSVVLFNPEQTLPLPVQYTYNVVGVYPHDSAAYTQGLVYVNGVLYEGTGLEGSSSLRRVELESGEVLQQLDLSEEYFGEGIAVVDDRIVQLTWQSKVGFIYDRETFSLIGQFNYETEGWGITFDGENLVMSDGTANLYFLDPTTFQKVRQVSVFDGNTSIFRLNELEFIKGDIYANIWLAEKIAIINPQTGQVKGWVDLEGLEPTVKNEANGIAYDKANDRLFVTGKYWPNIYEIKLVPQQ